MLFVSCAIDDGVQFDSKVSAERRRAAAIWSASDQSRTSDHWANSPTAVSRCRSNVQSSHRSYEQPSRELSRIVKLCGCPEIYSRQRLRSASSTDVVVPATRRSAVFTCRPRIPGRRSSSVECATAQCHLRTISVLIPATPEDISFPATTASITLITVSCSWSA